ncbi:MAG: GGDEF domain-containing protein [Candidatus Omnitrophota bacterium]
MYYVIFFVLAAIFILALSRWQKKRLEKIKAGYELIKGQWDLKLIEYRELDRENAALLGNVENLIELYEITKELTKYLSFEEIFQVFRDRLKEKITLEDCRFAESDKDLAGLFDYEFFPLMVEKELLGNLAIKGIRTEDRDKFHILLNQFNLILKRVNLYAKIEELSITDSLTGLYLRRFFQDRLEEEITRSKKFGLKFVFLMLDLDNFKTYNDRYGHLVGDVLLSTVAKIIKDNVRQIDIVARYGGEEFSVILPDIDREEGEYVSLRLCKAIEKELIHAYDEDLQITVSIGGSVFSEDAADAQELIDKADLALYHAKQTGRNRSCFWRKGTSAKNA